MTKKIHLPIVAIILFLLVLTVCGSFYDYEIANKVYIGQKPTENFFGVFFAFAGVVPTFVGWSFLGASILCLAKKQIQEKRKRRWTIALAILLFVLSFFYFCNTLFMVNDVAFSVHWAVAYPIGVVVIFAAAMLGYKLSWRSNNQNLLKHLLFLTVVSLLTMLLIMATKEIMDRPRFRFVWMENNPDFFRNWWQSGSDVQASLGSNAVSDEFSSFPSGHSAYAMFAIFLFSAFAAYDKRFEKYRGWLFFGGFVWWGLTAFSRMTVGAHYLTDVSIAGLITIFSYEIVVFIKYLIKKRLRP